MKPSPGIYEANKQTTRTERMATYKDLLKR